MNTVTSQEKIVYQARAFFLEGLLLLDRLTEMEEISGRIWTEHEEKDEIQWAKESACALLPHIEALGNLQAAYPVLFESACNIQLDALGEYHFHKALTRMQNLFRQMKADFCVYHGSQMMIIHKQIVLSMLSWMLYIQEHFVLKVVEGQTNPFLSLLAKGANQTVEEYVEAFEGKMFRYCSEEEISSEINRCKFYLYYSCADNLLSAFGKELSDEAITEYLEEEWDESDVLEDVRQLIIDEECVDEEELEEDIEDGINSFVMPEFLFWTEL